MTTSSEQLLTLLSPHSPFYVPSHPVLDAQISSGKNPWPEFVYIMTPGMSSQRTNKSWSKRINLSPVVETQQGNNITFLTDTRCHAQVCHNRLYLSALCVVLIATNWSHLEAKRVHSPLSLGMLKVLCTACPWKRKALDDRQSIFESVRDHKTRENKL